MDISENNAPSALQQLQHLLLTSILYTTTLILGAIACFSLIDIADLLIMMIIFDNPKTTFQMLHGVAFSFRCLFIFVSAVCIFLVGLVGAEFHLQNLGMRRSYSILALTIIAEIAIVLVYEILVRLIFQ